jgi:hypothetical protein
VGLNGTVDSFPQLAQVATVSTFTREVLRAWFRLALQSLHLLGSFLKFFVA